LGEERRDGAAPISDRPLDRSGVDEPLITKYIFHLPGGYIPALSEFMTAVEKAGPPAATGNPAAALCGDWLKDPGAKRSGAARRGCSLTDERSRGCGSFNLLRRNARAAANRMNFPSFTQAAGNCADDEGMSGARKARLLGIEERPRPRLQLAASDPFPRA